MEEKILIRCGKCGWIYDYTKGLTAGGWTIPINVKWEQIPDFFTCIQCHNPKHNLEEWEIVKINESTEEIIPMTGGVL